jgi:hypothetical protein
MYASDQSPSQILEQPCTSAQYAARSAVAEQELNQPDFSMAEQGVSSHSSLNNVEIIDVVSLSGAIHSSDDNGVTPLVQLRAQSVERLAPAVNLLQVDEVLNGIDAENQAEMILDEVAAQIDQAMPLQNPGWALNADSRLVFEEESIDVDGFTNRVVNFVYTPNVDQVVHKKYYSHLKRVLSFRSWPPGMPIPSGRLIQDGFFYQGRSDFTTCFGCNLTLGGWLSHHDVTQRHLEASPYCDAALMGQHLAQSQDIAEQAELGSLFMREGYKESPPPLINMCKICYVVEIQISYTPCKHAVSCRDCYYRSRSNICGICRAPIYHVDQVRMP